ncbi:MAG: peptidylprolyl isomerase [Patescibacteria group bacterium]|nr:peptidylprolyl isomerase [Patescibacteria group bacterium]
MNNKIIAAIAAVVVIAAGALFFISQKDSTVMNYAIIETPKGDIVMELASEKAPITVTNFKELVAKGFYNGLSFHRVVPGFVIQGGDPKGDGTGGSGKQIQLEIHPDLKHDSEGVLAMARSADPNSASSQFYITLAAQPSLDGNYAVFGKVLSGMDAVNQIRKGDVMTKVYLTDTLPTEQ